MKSFLESSVSRTIERSVAVILVRRRRRKGSSWVWVYNSISLFSTLCMVYSLPWVGIRQMYQTPSSTSNPNTRSTRLLASPGTGKPAHLPQPCEELVLNEVKGRTFARFGFVIIEPGTLPGGGSVAGRLGLLADLPQYILQNRPGRLRLCDPPGIGPHRLKEFRPFDELLHLEMQLCKIDCAHRRSLLDQVIGIPHFLPGDRVEDDHRQVLRERLRYRQSPRLGHQNIGALHQRLDEGNIFIESCLDVSGIPEAFELVVELPVLSADDEKLKPIHPVRSEEAGER